MSLLHYDDVEMGSKTDPSPGYPLICVTPCDPKYPKYVETRNLCEEAAINASAIRFSWEVRCFICFFLYYENLLLDIWYFVVDSSCAGLAFVNVTYFVNVSRYCTFETKELALIPEQPNLARVQVRN